MSSKQNERIEDSDSETDSGVDEEVMAKLRMLYMVLNDAESDEDLRVWVMALNFMDKIVPDFTRNYIENALEEHTEQIDEPAAEAASPDSKSKHFMEEDDGASMRSRGSDLYGHDSD
jgi:hypothetical protein